PSRSERRASMSWGAMTARKRRRNDPFLPPEAQERAPELVELPRRPAPVGEPVIPPRAPERRKPLRYRRPGTSWVTVVILAFAAVGMAALGGTLIKKLTGKRTISPAEK